MGQFMLPDLGEGLEEAQLTRWLVNVGDEVALNQHLCEVETAKALVEIPSPWAGVVQALHAQPGDTVAVGAALITIAQGDHAGGTVPGVTPEEVVDGEGPVLVGYGAHGPAQTFARRRRASVAETPAANGFATTATTATAPTATPIIPPAATPAEDGAVKASPLVRKIAAERGVDLARITGTGPGGRIRVEDLEASQADSQAVTAASGAAPARATSEEADEQRISTVGLRKAIAAKMTRSATTIPHFTEYGLFDASKLTALRQRLKGEPAYASVHLTFLPFFVRALTGAVAAHPIMNSRWDEEGNALVIRKRVHVGIATDTPRGLVVPVVRDAATLSLAQVAAECERLVALARDGRLDPGSMTGGSITITNVGAMGPVETGAPIINAPEVCIVGFGAIKPRPTVVGDALAVRPGAWISVSCDHRVVDGASAAQFMGALIAALEEPEALA
ncbi:MAG TPA: dihydrolipoamide acetyltransferase family protein [Ktedonobacterales bacterium]|nr:dihydrolipoamide acetyltransferase family protein [Ktedonobacterales bacterium]